MSKLERIRALALASIVSVILLPDPDALASPASRVRKKGAAWMRRPRAFRAPLPRQPTENADATFRSTHPMFRRLARSGWYARRGEIDGLRALGARLRRNRRVPQARQLNKGEYLVFDLETTGLSAGRFEAGHGFLAGWDDIAQFGYALIKDGKLVKSGKIALRPDVEMTQGALDATKLTRAEIEAGKPFEQAARQILELMQGRLLVGHNAKAMDWAWLRSSMARIGVELPGPDGLVLDSMLIAADKPAKRYNLATLAAKHGVTNPHAHDAEADAVTTAKVFLAETQSQGLVTVGDAWTAQARGEVKWAERVKRIVAWKAEQARKGKAGGAKAAHKGIAAN